jgi:hypothetical protein
MGWGRTNTLFRTGGSKSSPRHHHKDLFHERRKIDITRAQGTKNYISQVGFKVIAHKMFSGSLEPFFLTEPGVSHFLFPYCNKLFPPFFCSTVECCRRQIRDLPQGVPQGSPSRFRFASLQSRRQSGAARTTTLEVRHCPLQP